MSISLELHALRVVLDNLNTHNPAALYETFPASEASWILRRLEFHYTPKHARSVESSRARNLRAFSPVFKPSPSQYIFDGCDGRLILRLSTLRQFQRHDNLHRLKAESVLVCIFKKNSCPFSSGLAVAIAPQKLG